MKHQKRETGSGFISSPSNIARAMRGRIPKLPNFPALQNPVNNEQADLQSKLIIPQSSASTSALQQVIPADKNTTQNKRSSNRNGCSPS